MNEQLDSQGRLRHLVTLDGLNGDLLTGLMDRAEVYLLGPGKPGPGDGALDGLTVCQLFFEASTRTKISFELAARRQGADVVNLVIPTSSAAKGETVLDTLGRAWISAAMADILLPIHHAIPRQNSRMLGTLTSTPSCTK